jgi:catecholate siderophore receptor
VFLGPTGTDVGRGTAAGYVNMTTKTPAVQTRYAGAATFGTADQRRASVDVNQATPFGDAGSWWRGTALRLNALVQDRGVPGRDEVRLRTQAVAPSLAFGLGTHVRVAGGGRFLHQDNLPDYGIPGAAWPDGPLVPGAAVAPDPVDRRTTTARPRTTPTRSAESSFAKVECDVRPTVQLRSQLRYNQAHRTAVISTIRTRRRTTRHRARDDRAPGQRARERDHLEPDQRVDRRPRRTTSHALIGTVEFTSESQFAPALGDSARVRPPTSTRPTSTSGDGDERGPDRRFQRRHGVDRGGVGVRHRGRGHAPAAHRRHARRALRRDVPGA